jgi:serine/threonine-protein kinase
VIGSTISHYRITAKLGEGGMGEVYLAEDTRLERKVALKVLPSEVAADPERLRRFEQEARSASALSHPNIITIHDIGEHGPMPYIAMEFIEGKTLREIVSEGPLPAKKLLHLAPQIAEGLAKAHSAGIVHRDVKPENVMVTNDGYAKILDFGLAKLRPRPCDTDSDAATATMEGTVLGTVGYMSPEQAKGQPVDFRSDQFSLGSMLYEMATARRPFQRDTIPQTLSAIIEDDPEPIAGLNPKAPAPLRWIVERCLAKEANERYASTSDLAKELMNLRDHITEVPSEGAAFATRPSRFLTTKRIISLVGLLTAVLVLAVGLDVGGLRDRLLGVPGERQIESLAVLPLENLSGHPEQEYFADGMTEALIADLAQIGALRVISRTSVMRFKNTDKPLPQIARELNVDGIVEGSVLRAGERVRITAQLIHASTDRHIWAKSYERDLENILSLQKEVARAVATEIRVHVTEPERDRLLEGGRLDPEAYEAYLKGRWFWNRWTEEALWKGIEYFNRAIELDADCAPAHAGLADSYVALSFYSQADPREIMPKAKAAAVRALELDDTLAEAHASLGFVMTNYDFDWEGAEAEHKRAIELNPGSTTAHMMYMWYLVGMTRFDEALSQIRKAHETSPLDVYVNRAVGDALLYAGRYDEAIVALQRAIEMDPNFSYAHLNLGRAYLQKARDEEALAEFQNELSLSTGLDPLIRTWMGMAYAALGRKTEVHRILNDLTQRTEREYIPPSLLASLHFALGQDGEGFAWLDAAYQGRDGWLATIKADPRYDRVRQDPRFEAFLKKMGLTR